MGIDIKKASKIIEKYKGKKSALVAVLQDIQEKYKWLPPDTLKLVSQKLCVPLIDVYSVATFYRAFSLVPRGKHCVTVCMGTACHVRGAPNVLNRFEELLGVKAGGTTLNYSVTLETVNCLGACALAPIVVVDGKYHGQVSGQKAASIVTGIKPKSSKKTKMKK
jgi:NADH-quinone oxidoreductase subunit E